jgi:exopolysaccharide production protein ExoQ
MPSRISETSRDRSYNSRQNRPALRAVLGGPTSKAMIDRCAIIPILVCVFATIVSPLIYTVLGLPPRETRLDTRVFWPAMATISVYLARQYRSHLPRPLPPHVICLIVYLALAGASILWSFNPWVSFIRFAQEAMIITSIVLPGLVAFPKADMMSGLFIYCFVPAAILNIFFVFENDPGLVAGLKGYPGFFLGKNYLGEFAAIPLLMALHEMYHSGFRRALGIVVVPIAFLLLFWSNSKTAFGLALVCPFIAGLTLLVRRATRTSPAMILLLIPLSYLILSSVSNFGIERISYMVYGDSSLSGRTVIWDFANYEIARKPLLGWGYQSFWIAGPGSPGIVDAPGWVKEMPDGHNGYVDTKLELGYAGLGLLLVFIITTLHGVGRMADRNPARAWLVLSLALYVIAYNFFESLWMRSYEFLWVLFVILAVEIARYWQPFPPTVAGYGSRTIPSGFRRLRRSRRPSRRIVVGAAKNVLDR